MPKKGSEFSLKSGISNDNALGTYRLVRPEEIEPLAKVPEFPRKDFTEEEFASFIRQCQPHFEDLQNFLQHKRLYLCPDGSATEHPGSPEQPRPDLIRVWINPSNRVTVRLTVNGTYQLARNGRHRLYVAKKYGLSIPVYIMEVTRQKEPETGVDQSDMPRLLKCLKRLRHHF